MASFLMALLFVATALAPTSSASAPDPALLADDECADGTCALNALQVGTKASVKTHAQEEEVQAELLHAKDSVNGSQVASDAAGSDRFWCGSLYCGSGFACCLNGPRSICCPPRTRCQNWGQVMHCA